MDQGTTLTPVRGRARIEVLDILRGLAILGIFYMNIPGMAQNMPRIISDVRSIGWAPADRWTWIAIQTFLEGTQRGVLELLFGAGMMVLTARAMHPDGPVAVADLYVRRNLWLLAFGLLDIFAMLWIGDILHIYALAALFLFPFRLLRLRWLLPLGLAFAIFTAVTGTIDYVERVELQNEVAQATAHAAAGMPLSAQDRKAQAEWRKKEQAVTHNAELAPMIQGEVKARQHGLVPYVVNNWTVWITLAGRGLVLMGVLEAFCVMLLGIALWKLGVIQGERSSRFYAALLVGCYVFGLGARFWGALEVTTFQPIPKQIWITAELARIATSIGHVALVNLAIRTRLGHALLAPFRAAGRTAFSLYFLTSFIGLWVLFAPWGLIGWGRLGWAEMAIVATIVCAGLLALANVWVRYFANGPLEWAWRSLAYVQWQPFRVNRRAEALPGPNALPV